jgi:hypothetical protein
MAFNSNITPGSPPLLWSNVDEAFREINQNFDILVATIGDGSGLIPLDFNTLDTSVSPIVTDTYNLGSASKKWKNLYIGDSGLYVGNAVITATDNIINLPAGSTIGGNILDQEYFKTITVDGQSSIVAEPGGEDALNLSAGTGIVITTTSDTDTITFANFATFVTCIA